MTDIAMVEDEVCPTPNSDFADWMSSVQVGLDRDNFQLRWNTIYRLFIDLKGDLDDSWVDELLKLALGNLKNNPEFAARLCSELKKDDVMFSNSGGQKDEELQVLASYSLKLLLDDSIWDEDFVCMNLVKIQGASLSNRKRFKGGVDLLSYVSEKRFNLCRKRRKKQHIKGASSHFKKSEEFEKEFQTLEDSGAHATYNKNALLALKSELFSQLLSTNISLKKQTTRINSELNKLAEEQEVLWLASIGWSEHYDKPYNELSLEKKMLSIAISLAERTLMYAELPSVKGVAAKLGVESRDVQFSDWVENFTNNEFELLSEYLSDIDELTPILLSLKLASDGKWKTKWRELTGVDYNVQICSRALSLQLYRELLIVKWS
ncbi:GTPase-associated system all-helical protein GASH [Vibrio sp. 10N.222.54.F6]|uniref:GTPase-associated system all-helical protein GASH n=1 Tax=unclassified Vibrio TaxID=2614977 RepID=UPI00354AFBBA